MPEGASVEATGLSITNTRQAIEIRDRDAAVTIARQILEAVEQNKDARTIKMEFAEPLSRVGIDWEKHIGTAANLVTIAAFASKFIPA